MNKCKYFVCLFGAEAQSLKADMINCLEAIEMDSCADQPNMLNRPNVVRELLKTVRIRKIRYLGYTLRGGRYRNHQLIMKSKIQGRRGIGLKQMSWLKHFRDQTGIRSAQHLFRLAEYPEQLASVNVIGTCYDQKNF